MHTTLADAPKTIFDHEALQLLAAVFESDDCFLIDPLVVDDRRWERIGDLLADEDEAAAFLAHLDRVSAGKRNVYYSLNAREQGRTGRDGTLLARCHAADFDPPKDEQKRAIGTVDVRDVLRRIEAAGFPPPTAVVHTGGGVQTLWRMVEPYEREQSEEWEHRQKWIAEALGSDDAITDWQRLLRLPGYANRKDAYDNWDHPPVAHLVDVVPARRYSWRDLEPSVPEPTRDEKHISTFTPPTNGERCERPGDDFNLDGPAIGEQLQAWSNAKDGRPSWRPLGRPDEQGRQTWTMNGSGPGPRRKTAVVDFDEAGRERAWVFDTACKELPHSRQLHRFDVYAWLNHPPKEGDEVPDYRIAAAEVARMGFGQERVAADEEGLLLPTGDEADFGGADLGLLLTPYSDIERTTMKWLWPNRIHGAGLTLITGPVGTTKSLMTIDLAARVSLGAKWPDGSGTCEQGKVLLLGGEDDPGSVVRPRLEAAGADLSRVILCQRATTDDDDDPTILLERDIRRLRTALVADPEIKLVVFDPLSDYMAGDENSSKEVRAALMPLVKLAQDTETAIVGIAHQNKKTDLSGAQRIAGSSAFGQVARIILSIGDHPEDDISDPFRRRVMIVSKTNCGVRFEGQLYRLIDRMHKQVAIEWIHGLVTMSDDDLKQKPGGGKGAQDRRCEAVDVLRDVLGDGQWHRAADVLPRLHSEGVSERAEKAAVRVLQIEKLQFAPVGETKAVWHWRLPVDEPEQSKPDPAFDAWRDNDERG